MADIFWGIIFVVIFYYVFKTIWNNVTTVSFNGLEGFFHSWGNQAFWAFVITCVIVAIIAKVLDWIINAFDMDGILKYLIGGFICYLFFSNSDESNQSSTSSSVSQSSQSTAQLFAKKTFMENYNRNVRELRQAENLNEINNEPCTADALTLPEDFLTKHSEHEFTEAIQFPNLSIIQSDLNNPEVVLILDFASNTAVNQLEILIAKITFTAAIEAVAPGKSREIERALSSIDSNGSFCLPPYSYEEQKKFEGEYDKDGVHYILSRGDNLLTLGVFYFG